MLDKASLIFMVPVMISYISYPTSMVFGGCWLNEWLNNLRKLRNDLEPFWSHFGAIGAPQKNRKKPRYHTFASTQDARRFAYSFDCRNEGGYEPARIAEACKMTFQDFVMLGINTKDGPPSYPLVMSK